MAKILVIEDEENIRFSVRRALAKRGHMVEEAGSLGGGLEAAERLAFDLVLTDLHLPDGDGTSVVERLRGDGFDGAIVVMTAYGTIESAVQAMKLGADDYLQKPVSLDELVILADRLLEQRQIKRRLRLYERQASARKALERPLGESEAWTRTLELAERVARLPTPTLEESGGADGGTVGGGKSLPTVLLVGETGSGKGVLARHIHRVASGDPDKTPFVHVNCSSLPATLVESELFGHEKGAFTDARTAREGLVEMAEGGTLFLDEIGDMPLEMQAKILLFLEHGRFRRVGGSRERSVRCRVIAATNHDLEKEAGEGVFRSDLLYRLNAFTVEVPPLRERDDDAVEIAREMLARFRAEYGLPACNLSSEAERAIASHAWPGNVREVINAMQRAAMLCESESVGPADLGLRGSPVLGKAAPIASPNGKLRFDFQHGVHKAEEVERELMVQALETTRGNVSKAARLIGMQRSSFRYRVERYGLEERIREMAEQ
ncbi:MAG: sigma-54 dependent transcriptional regulator [Phycisphaerales bacterium]